MKKNFRTRAWSEFKSADTGDLPIAWFLLKGRYYRSTRGIPGVSSKDGSIILATAVVLEYSQLDKCGGTDGLKNAEIHWMVEWRRIVKSQSNKNSFTFDCTHDDTTPTLWHFNNYRIKFWRKTVSFYYLHLISLSNVCSSSAGQRNERKRQRQPRDGSPPSIWTSSPSHRCEMNSIRKVNHGNASGFAFCVIS